LDAKILKVRTDISKPFYKSYAIQLAPPNEPCIFLESFYISSCRVSLAEYNLVLRVLFPPLHVSYFCWVLHHLLPSCFGWCQLSASGLGLAYMPPLCFCWRLLLNWHYIGTCHTIVVSKLYCFHYQFKHGVVINIVNLVCNLTFRCKLCVYDVCCSLNLVRSWLWCQVTEVLRDTRWTTGFI
jgi:hypothetical protein